MYRSIILYFDGWILAYPTIGIVWGLSNTQLGQVGSSDKIITETISNNFLRQEA
jgi:hypothetical protein